MDKKLKRIIIVIAIVILIIISILIYFITKSSAAGDSIAVDPGEADPEQDESMIELKDYFSECESFDEYFAVRDIINYYNQTCASLNINAEDIEVYDEEITKEDLEEAASQERETAQNTIYDMLSKKYIDEFDVKTEDMKKLSLDKNTESVIDRMHVIQNSFDVSTYFVDLTDINTENSSSKQRKIAVSVDFLNNTFMIFPEEYCEKHNFNNLEIGDKIDDFSIDSIEANDENMFESRIAQENEVALEYYNNYHIYEMYNLEKAYNMLNNDYKNKRFGTLENYKKYIDENRNDIEEKVVTKYQVVGDEGEKQYICVDSDNKYYVFNQKTISNYDLCLDTYTIDSQDFIYKYDNGNDQKKAGMNVEKFIEAVNTQDYTYIYNHLAESFKNNYFNNQETLAKFIKENLFKYNNKEYKGYEQQGNNHIYKLKIINGQNQSNDENENTINENKNMTVIIQLTEERDYIMSFSME